MAILMDCQLFHQMLIEDLAVNFATEKAHDLFLDTGFSALFGIASAGIIQERPFLIAPIISPFLHICCTLRAVVPICTEASEQDKYFIRHLLGSFLTLIITRKTKWVNWNFVFVWWNFVIMRNEVARKQLQAVFLHAMTSFLSFCSLLWNNCTITIVIVSQCLSHLIYSHLSFLSFIFRLARNTPHQIWKRVEVALTCDCCPALHHSAQDVVVFS